jgi:bifunctional enzyme CysN/CysC
VIRPNGDFRGYAGRIVSGTIRAGEEIAVLPSGLTSAVSTIVTYDGEIEEAGQSIVMTLRDNVDVARGDMIVRCNNLPMSANEFEAIICWMHDRQLNPLSSYVLKHTTRAVTARIPKLLYRIDVNTLHRAPAETLAYNEIGRARIHAPLPVFYDSYRINRITGSFILIDPASNDTAAAGVIRGPVRTVNDVRSESLAASGQPRSLHVSWHGWNIDRESREQARGHAAAVVWFTGYSGAGKSTIARALEKRLFALGVQTMLLDGDNIRHGLCSDLAFSDEDRTENIRRAGEVAKLFFENGAVAICTFISPFASQRGFARSLIPQGRFFEIYVRCDLEVCKRRDPKGLYKKALASEIPDFTGVSSRYEEPLSPEMVVDTDLQSTEPIVDGIMDRMAREGIFRRSLR